MDGYEAIISTIALTAGASWASGINLYAVLLVLGLGGVTGSVSLPEGLDVLQNPMVIGAAGLMYCVEFFADKIPGVDTSWDALHTFVRIPAGAMLAAGSIGDVTPALEVAAGILGGSLAATSHATKAGSRMLINTSPEPFTNWGASIGEDALVIAGLWTALNHPILFIVLLIGFIFLAVWLLPKIWRLLVTVLKKIGRFLGFSKGNDESHEMYSASANASASTNALNKQPADWVTQLERLQQLRASGALTEDEFTQQKKRLLGES